MIRCLSFYVITIVIIVVKMAMMMMSLLMVVSLEPYLDTRAQWLIVQDQEHWLMIITTIMIMMINIMIWRRMLMTSSVNILSNFETLTHA